MQAPSAFRPSLPPFSPPQIPARVLTVLGPEGRAMPDFCSLFDPSAGCVHATPSCRVSFTVKSVSGPNRSRSQERQSQYTGELASRSRPVCVLASGSSGTGRRDQGLLSANGARRLAFPCVSSCHIRWKALNTSRWNESGSHHHDPSCHRRELVFVAVSVCKSHAQAAAPTP